MLFPAMDALAPVNTFFLYACLAAGEKRGVEKRN
jgi:hypothetical protein